MRKKKSREMIKFTEENEVKNEMMEGKRRREGKWEKRKKRRKEFKRIESRE